MASSSSSLFLSSSRFTSSSSSSSIPITVKSWIGSRRRQQKEVNNAASLGFSGLVLKKKNNLGVFSKGLLLLPCRADSSSSSSSSSKEGDSSSSLSSSLFVILGKICRSYLISNRMENHDKLRYISLLDDENVPSEFHDKPVLMTEGEKNYCNFVIGLVNQLKSGVLMVKDSFIELLRVLVLPHIIYFILISIMKGLLRVTRIVYLTVNSVFKALFGVEDGVGNLLEILENVLFKWVTKSKLGKRWLPKPPKPLLKTEKKPVQEKVANDVFGEDVDDV